MIRRSTWLCLFTLLTGCNRVRNTVESMLGQDVEADEHAEDALQTDVGRAGQDALSEFPDRLQERLQPLSRWPKDPPRWTTPPCPLRYRYWSEAMITMPGAPPTADFGGLRLTAEVTMTAGADGRSVLRNGDIEISHVTNGIKRPGSVQPADSLAEVRLEHDGVSWTEVDGPTALWSPAEYTGLTQFWPKLPASSHPGSRTPWPIEMHARGDGARVESKRGKTVWPDGMAFPEPSSTLFPAEVELESWVLVQDEPAAVLVARFEHAGKEDFGSSQPGIEGFGATFEMTQVSRHIVLSSGRLLYGQVDRTTHVTMVTPGDSQMKQEQRWHAEFGLVEACDGPVIDTPSEEVASPEEIALDAIARFRNALAAGTDDEVIDRLDPTIVEAHGDAVLRTLRKHTKLHGASSLGVAELSDAVERDGDRVKVELWGPSDYFLDGYNLSVAYELEVRDGRALIISIEARKQYQSDAEALLEVSAKRLESRQPPRGEPIGGLDSAR